MYALSYWAKSNPRKARWIIAGSLVLTGSIAFHAGVAYFAVAQSGHAWVMLLLSVLGLHGCALAYRFAPTTVWRRATIRASIVSVWLFCFGSGHHSAFMAYQPEAADQVNESLSKTKERVQLMSLEGNSVQKAKTFFRWIKSLKVSRYKREVEFWQKKRAKDNTLDTFTKAILTLVTLLLFAIVLYFVAWLSCTLSCDGAETAATVVLLFGLALSLWGLVAALRAIWRKPKRDLDQIEERPERRAPSKRERQ